MNLANEFNLNPIFAALNGGEIMNYCLQSIKKHYEKPKKDIDFTIIGFVNDKMREAIYDKGRNS